MVRQRSVETRAVGTLKAGAVIIPMLGACAFSSTVGDATTDAQIAQERTVPKASFDEDYRKAHSGEVLVETPDAHELVNVVIALTGAGAVPENGLIALDTDYHRSILGYFSAHRTHPVVERMHDLLERNIRDHMEVKIDSSAYSLCPSGRLEKRPEYGWIRGTKDAFAAFRAAMEDFALQSDFCAFFGSLTAQNAYREAFHFFREQVQVEGLIAWLDRHFPGQEAYESIRIIVSPLVYGWQHQDIVADGEFEQLVLHVHFPGSVSEQAELSPEAQYFDRAYSLFTELNHGYIDPRDPAFERRIERALSGRESYFVERSSGNVSYESGFEVFLEYVNWVLISVYACDNFSSLDCASISRSISEVMEKRRGFIAFGPFQSFVRERMKFGGGSRVVSELYPEMADWFSSYTPSGG